ncbi:WD40 repeat-like protein [Paxillus ammoniavirescens]|nr:WD40 repeat-like protein [Paxillus ammoniavirescens]
MKTGALSCDVESSSCDRALTRRPSLQRRIASPSFVAWTPDHELIVGCKNGSIKRFSSSIVSLLATRSAHTDWVCSIAVSPNGKFMASASCDKTIRLWNTTTFTQIGPTLQCDVEVWTVAISPAGDHLVSGGRGGRVRIWNLKGMISRALLVDMQATSNAMAGANDSSSSSTLIMPAHWEREILSTLDEPLFEQPPPPPPKIIINSQGNDSGSLVSVPLMILLPGRLGTFDITGPPRCGWQQREPR